MRWKFADVRNLDDASGREAILNAIHSWWREFQDRSEHICALFSRKVEWDLAAWMYEHLGAIDPDLMWELDEVLKPAKLGCQIGGATGLKYSNIELALSNLKRGIRAVRKRLQKGRVPKRSWILFHDADLAAEWVGIYDDSPPPPVQLPDD
jgi:hypothetical protein